MKTHEVVVLCVDEILKILKRKNKLFVAITGDSGSGKSYYSNLIRKDLEKRKILYSYINADDFLIPRVDRESMKNQFYTSGKFKGKSKWEILENMFRLREFNKVIDNLRKKGVASYTPYKRETGCVTKNPITITANKLVIFDTSMLFNRMDYIIMVDANIEKIIERKIIRDSDVRTSTQIREMHRKVQGYYWQRMKPKKPDIIIDNNDFDKPKIIVN